MKYIYPLFLILLFTVKQSEATVHTIDAQGITFIPSELDVLVGDTITWIWVDGLHTTTSTNIPGEASEWDMPLDQDNPEFSYVVTTPGVYDYVCLFHEAQGMVGTFTATASSSTDDLKRSMAVTLTGNPVQDYIYLTFEFPYQMEAGIQLYNVMGIPVIDYGTYKFNAGRHAQALPVLNTQPGAYFLEVRAAEDRVTKRVFIR